MAFQRIVCFKFKKTTTIEEIQRHVEDFYRLKQSIPQIKTYYAGKTIPGDYGIAPEYDFMHYMTFTDEKDIETYFNHEEHQNFIKSNKSIWEKAMVLNSGID